MFWCQTLWSNLKWQKERRKQECHAIFSFFYHTKRSYVWHPGDFISLDTALQNKTMSDILIIQWSCYCEAQHRTTATDATIKHNLAHYTNITLIFKYSCRLITVSPSTTVSTISPVLQRFFFFFFKHYHLIKHAG